MASQFAAEAPSPSVPRRIRRSRILVPGAIPRMLDKARGFAADVVLLDLQDAVPPREDAKQSARANVVAAIKDGGFNAREVTVRVNDVGTAWFVADVQAVVEAGVDSISLPHAMGLADVLFAERLIQTFADQRPVELLLQIETPKTLHELRDIARWSKLITAVSLGPADFALEMGSRAFVRGASRGSDHVYFARQSLLLVGRAMGWNATDTAGGGKPDDLDAIRASMTASRDLGFDGASVLYPKHIDIANEVFGVSDVELAWATDVIDVYEARDPDRAVTTTDGYLVLPAHYECARRLRDLAQRLGVEPDAPIVSAKGEANARA
jgi:citrate lyase subunit beta/citryl-CoA lyase